MPIQKLYAQLNCTDIETSAAWYKHLFARNQDMDPMDGVKEWHHGSSAGFQLVFNPERAGHGSMTVILSDLHGEHARLVEAGLEIGAIVAGDFASFAALRDPDGNTVVLAEPKEGD